MSDIRSMISAGGLPPMGDRGTLGRHPGGHSLRGVIDEASQKARRALQELEAEGWLRAEGRPAGHVSARASTRGGSPLLEDMLHSASISPARRRAGGGVAGPLSRGLLHSRGYAAPASTASPSHHSTPRRHESTPRRAPRGDSLARAVAGDPTLQQGEEVVLLDAPTLLQKCAELRCPVPHRDVDAFCDGRRVGRLLTVADGVAAVDFGHEILAVPASCVASRRQLKELRRDLGRPSPPQSGGYSSVHASPAGPPPRLQRAGVRQPSHPPPLQPSPARAAHDKQVSQLLKSLRYKSNALKRTEDELTTSRKEVYILKKQLDKAGLASWVTAQVVRGPSIYLPRVDTSVPVGTDISHHLDVSSIPIDAQDFHAERGYPRRPPSVQGEEIGLGREGYCSLVAAPRRDGNPHGATLYAHNSTNDMQIDVCLKLGQDGVQGSAHVIWSRNAPRSFTLRVFPGQTEAVVQLNQAWNRVYSVSFSYGPVTDADFLQELRANRAAVVEAEMRQVKALAHRGAPASPHQHQPLPVGGVDASGPSPQESSEHLLDLCVEHGVMFIDPAFPPTAASILTSPTAGFSHPVSWMRPCMFTASTALYTDEHFNSRALLLGSLGDACFVDAVALLLDTGRGAQRGWLLKKILAPPLTDAALQEERDLGIHRVSLCTDGWWRWTVVDDYLPMQNGTHFSVAFAHSAVQAEVWVGILEKAYAKSLGAYHRLLSGHVDHTLEDLTGSPCTVLSWEPGEAALWDRLLACLTPRGGQPPRQQPFFAARGSGGGGGGGGNLEWNGAMVPGRLYPILDAAAFEAEGLRVVKVRNLWGDSSMWNGYLCPESPVWRQPGYEHIRRRLTAPLPDLDAPQDAPPFTLWLTWDEAQKYFERVGVYQNPGDAWDVRFRTGFTDARTSHVFLFEVCRDTEALVSVIQPMYQDARNEAVQPAALRAEVLEQGAGGWELVVETDAAYIRERTMHAPPFHFRAGCTYVVILHQWAKEPDEYLRNRQDVVLRVGTQQQHYGLLRVLAVTKEMSEALRYDRYPSFSPFESTEVTVEAQQDGVDCLSSAIMPAGPPVPTLPVGTLPAPAPAHMANRLAAPALGGDAAASDSDASSEGGGPLLTDVAVARPPPCSPPALRRVDGADPYHTASRLRLLTDASGDLHPADKTLLSSLANSLDGGYASMQQYLGQLYVPDRRD